MKQEDRGGIVGTYSSGVKMTLKVRKPPMETTIVIPKNVLALFADFSHGCLLAGWMDGFHF